MAKYKNQAAKDAAIAEAREEILEAEKALADAQAEEVA